MGCVGFVCDECDVWVVGQFVDCFGYVCGGCFVVIDDCLDVGGVVCECIEYGEEIFVWYVEYVFDVIGE